MKSKISIKMEFSKLKERSILWTLSTTGETRRTKVQTNNMERLKGQFQEECILLKLPPLDLKILVLTLMILMAQKPTALFPKPIFSMYKSTNLEKKRISKLYDHRRHRKSSAFYPQEGNRYKKGHQPTHAELSNSWPYLSDKMRINNLYRYYFDTFNKFDNAHES